MLGAAFDPKSLVVKAGSKVTWRDTGTSQMHNVVFKDANGNDIPAYSRREVIPPNGTFSATFLEPGMFRYLCEFHALSLAQGMTGSVTVV